LKTALKAERVQTRQHFHKNVCRSSSASSPLSVSEAESSAVNERRVFNLVTDVDVPIGNQVNNIKLVQINQRGVWSLLGLIFQVLFEVEVACT